MPAHHPLPAAQPAAALLHLGLAHPGHDNGVLHHLETVARVAGRDTRVLAAGQRLAARFTAGHLFPMAKRLHERLVAAQALAVHQLRAGRALLVLVAVVPRRVPAAAPTLAGVGTGRQLCSAADRRRHHRAATVADERLARGASAGRAGAAVARDTAAAPAAQLPAAVSGAHVNLSHNIGREHIGQAAGLGWSGREERECGGRKGEAETAETVERAHGAWRDASNVATNCAGGARFSSHASTSSASQRQRQGLTLLHLWRRQLSGILQTLSHTRVCRCPHSSRADVCPQAHVTTTTTSHGGHSAVS